MMYLSLVDRYDYENRQMNRDRDFHIAVALNNYFPEKIVQIHQQLTILPDVELVKIKWPIESTRLIEKGFEYYEDKTVYAIPPCEDALEYYGWELEKEYYPTQGFWEDHLVPEVAYLCWYKGTFSFELNWHNKQYEGYGMYVDEWIRRLK